MKYENTEIMYRIQTWQVYELLKRASKYVMDKLYKYLSKI